MRLRPSSDRALAGITSHDKPDEAAVTKNSETSVT